ncbi:MAG TPA: ABC transporter ATP-binding protein [Thermomicrobiales bacterium]|nr:ABC transporter ATP-binding protein [Thermomicrobiales bacterium]
MMLKIAGIQKAFGDRAVIDGIDLEVRQGEFVALLGPSGSGKTTLLRLIAGFEDADAGEIRLANRIVVHKDISVPPERRKIGMVFQDYALFPHLSVRDNVAFGLPRGKTRNNRVHEVLERVGLGPWIDQMPQFLSGGQQQRVALARALAPNPSIVMLDEPFSNLDPALRIQVRADVRRILQEAGVTAILVTHDQEEALSIADRIAVLFNGRITQVGTPEDVYERPVSREVAAFVGDAQFLPGTAQETFAETEIGRLELLKPAEGPVDLLIRPEMISLAPYADDPKAVPGTVRSRRFFGRDQQVDVVLASGTEMTARVPALHRFAAGERASVSVAQPVLPFPKQSDPV